MHYYHRQQTAREMLMDRDQHHRIALVELVGGPLDGKRFRRAEGDAALWFEDDRRATYRIGEAYYRPARVDGGVLYLKYLRHA